MKFIKNNTEITRIFRDTTITPNEYYDLPIDQESGWASDNNVVSAIFSGMLVVAKDDSGLTDMQTLEGLNYFRNIMPASVQVTAQPSTQPFSAKTLADGSKLFRRKHGQSVVAITLQSTNIDFVVPYLKAKINAVEFIGANELDRVDLLVLDTADGLIQQSLGVAVGDIVPNLMLNQFGFDVLVSSGLYKDVSEYDADLIQNMIVRIVYKNDTTSNKKVGCNLVYHEIKG